MSETQRSLTRPERIVHAFLMSRPGIWFGRYVLPYLDRPLLYLSRGRISMSHGQPILLLVTVGAKSGQQRTTPLLYQHDNDRLIVIASNGGRDRHPGWYFNLRAHPEVTVYIGGQIKRYRAREAEDEERAALWRAAVDFFIGFELYERRTSRHIPVMVLTPLADKQES